MAPLNLLAQERYFAGAVGGLSTLSGDGKSFIQPPRLESSSYKPENGPALAAFFGAHLNDFFSVQAGYLWNTNDLRLSWVSASSFFDQPYRSSQNSVLAEAMLYFRPRSSWVRPYLSVGTGIARLSADADGAVVAGPGAVPPPSHFASSGPALHVAVGIDLRVRRGWYVRYTFGETIRGNVISNQLEPPGERNLANFRNLFGFVRTF